VADSAPQRSGRGRLHLYLGVAPGAGKTYALLAEGCRLAASGADVVVGVAETHGRPDTDAQIRDLERVPPRRVAYRGAAFEELDLSGVLTRRPQVVLIDELAHTTVPGCRNGKRWQDVEELLDAGIDVVSCLNVQHLESLSDTAQQLTGVAVTETVPDAVAAAADRVDLLDIGPAELRDRMTRLYPPDTAERALSGYFQEGNLAALRGLGRRWIRGHSFDGTLPSATPSPRGAPIIAALAGEPEGGHVLRRAARLAATGGTELIGVYVREPSGLVQPEPPWLEGQRRLLAELGGRYAEITGADVAMAVLDFARAEHAAQLVLGATRRTRAYETLHGSVIARTIRHAGPIEVHVIPALQPPKHPLTAHLRLQPRHRRVALPPRRRLVGWLLAVVAPVAITAALTPLRSSLGLAGALLCVLLAVVASALVGGIRPAAAATVIGFLAADFFFTVPYYSLRIDRTIDVVGLIVFASVAAATGLLVDVLTTRGIQSAHSQAEADSLARLAAEALALGPGARQGMAAALRRTFELDAVAVFRRAGPGWQVIAAAGEPVPTAPDEAQFQAKLTGGDILALGGNRLAAQDARLLREFVTELGLAQERMQLRRIGPRPSGDPATDGADQPAP